MARKYFTVEGYTGRNPDFEIDVRLLAHQGKVALEDVMAALEAAFINGESQAIAAGGCGDYLSAWGNCGADGEERPDLAEDGEQVFLFSGQREWDSEEEEPTDFMLRICAA